MKKDKKKKVNEEEQEEKKESVGAKIFNSIIPYILAVISAILLLALADILPGPIGTFFDAIAIGLKGSVSAWGAWFLALLVLYHAFVWKYDIKKKICVRRVICSLVLICSIGTLQHLIEYPAYGGEAGSNVYQLFMDAISSTDGSHGGGVVGGLIGFVLYEKTHWIFAYVVVAVTILFMALQLFNITPFSIVSGIVDKKEKDKNTDERRRREKLAKKNKHKKVDIFDDGEDTAEVNLREKTKDKPPAYLDVSQLINEEPPEENKPAEPSEQYEDLGRQVVNSRQLRSSQLRPYDESKDGIGQASLEVRKTKLEEEEDEIEPWDNIPTLSSFNQQEDELSETTTTYFNPADTQKRPENSYREENNSYTPSEPQYQRPQETSYGYSAPSSYEPKQEYKPEPAYEPWQEYKPEQACESKPVFEPEVEEEEEEYTPSFTFERDEDEEEPSSRFSYEPEQSYKEDENEDEYTQDYEEDEYSEPEVEAPLPTTPPVKKSEILTRDDDDQIVKYDDYVSSSKLARNVNQTKDVKEKREEKVEQKFVPKPKKNYVFPPISYLQYPEEVGLSDEAREELQENARIIVDTLNNFNIRTHVINVTRGPTVTRYELAPEAGVRVRSIANLSDDIALQLAAEGLRIECPIPGKSAVGIEVPNRITSMVYLRELLEDSKFKSAKGPMTCALGKSIAGENIYVDIEKTPHLLIAGATGMGKSVCINSLLVSLLYKATPDEVRLILIDPKRVELSNYNGVPHLLVPVVCEPKKSLGALQWAVTEMEKRFETIESAGVRNLHEFNEKVDNGYPADKMARILIVIDELADLKMAVPDIEGHITRLTQKARAAGIHIIIGTQRPSVDVITGLIKSNIPSRIAFRVPSQVDSRTILDEVGAEKLVSRGDMLVKIVGALRPARVQGSFVKASEIQYVIDFWKENSPAEYDEEVMHQIDSNAAKLAKNDKEFDDEGSDGQGEDGSLDPEFYNALELACEMGKISSSFLQRKLRLGFQRAARIIDQMEECGYIGEANGSKPRDVLITKEDFRELMMRRSDE